MSVLPPKVEELRKFVMSITHSRRLGDIAYSLLFHQITCELTKWRDKQRGDIRPTVNSIFFISLTTHHPQFAQSDE